MKDFVQLALIIFAFVSVLFLLIIVIRATDYGVFCKKTYCLFSDYKTMKQLQKESAEINRQIQEQIAIGKELDNQIKDAKDTLKLLEKINTRGYDK